MKKTKVGKKFAGLLLAFILVFSMLPINALAETAPAANETETPEQTYAPYRAPAEILTTVYGKTEAQAQEILSGANPAAYPTVAYVHDFTELSAAAGNSAIEVIVVCNDIQIENTVALNRSVSILAEQKVELRTGAGGETPSESFFTFDFRPETADQEIGGNAASVLRFSNVVIRCGAEKNGGIHAEPKETDGTRVKSYIEGAYIVYVETYSGETAIAGDGDVNLHGCTLINGNNSGFRHVHLRPIDTDTEVYKCKFVRSSGALQIDYVKEGKNILVRDCEFLGGTSPFYSINTPYAKTITLQDCIVKNFSCEGVYLTAEEAIVVKNVDVLNSPESYSGMQFYADAPSFTADGLNMNAVEPVYLVGTEQVTISNSNFTVTDGFEQMPGSWNFGGANDISLNNTTFSGYDRAIFCSLANGQNPSTLTLNGCTIQDCDVGINVEGTGTVRLTNSTTITGNSTAGIHSFGVNLCIEDSTISNNGSPENSHSEGGISIYNYGGLSISNSQITNNYSAHSGGGLCVNADPSSTAKITDHTVFSGNEAAESGGAIWVNDYTKLETDETTSFTENKAANSCQAPESITSQFPKIQAQTASVGGNPINNFDIAYADPTIVSAEKLERITNEQGSTTAAALQKQLEAAHPQIDVTLSTGEPQPFPVTWNVPASGYDGNKPGLYHIYGDIRTGDSKIYNYANVKAEIEVKVLSVPPTVESVDPLEPISVEYGTTTAEDLLSMLQTKYPEVKVNLDNGKFLMRPVTWDVSTSEPAYNGEISGTYTIHGAIDLGSNSEIVNHGNLRAKVEVTVGHNPNWDIVQVLPEEISVPQNILLAPTDKENEFGAPTLVNPPEMVTVQLKTGEPAQLPVNWHTDEFDPAKVGEQTITGDVILDGQNKIRNPKNREATLKINVSPMEYLLWQASPTEVTVKVLPGTTLKEINELLEAEGKNELAVDAFDSEDIEVWTFCPFTLDEASNPQWAEQMDIPNADGYTLTATLPENFTPLSEEDPGAIHVKVIVKEPEPIVEVETVRVNEYQSVDPRHFDNIPQRVNAKLESGLVVPIDVEWDMSSYAKDTAGDQPVIGTLVNFPSKVKQPAEGDYTGNMVIHVIPVSYHVTGLLSDNFFEPKAGLTLAEITELESPVFTYEITSVTEGITLTTDYDVPVVLEDEKNPDFDPKSADAYVISGTMTFPENISTEAYPLYDEVLLDTQPVQVLSMESGGVLVREGTPVEEIGMPETVVATLDVAGPDGKNKTELLSVQWDESGYDPYPPELTDDTPVVETITGSVTSVPLYIITPAIQPVLSVTVCREFDIAAITPSRFPETGVMEVNLGSTLEDIYGKLDRHTVQLTLRSTNGTLSTADVGFALRQEDNRNYDPMELKASTLTAYIELPENVKNPDNLGVEIAVETKKHNISSVKAERVTGVLKGTPFAEIPMPKTVKGVLDNGLQEDIEVASWNGTDALTEKIGTKVVQGTFVDPLPVYLENPQNRTPKCFVSVVEQNAQIVSMEQVFEPQIALMSNETEDQDVPGYVENKYIVKVQHKDGSITKEIISMYAEDR